MMTSTQRDLARSVVNIVKEREELQGLLAWAALRRLEGADEDAIVNIVEMIHARAHGLGMEL